MTIPMKDYFLIFVSLVLAVLVVIPLVVLMFSATIFVFVLSSLFGLPSAIGRFIPMKEILIRMLDRTIGIRELEDTSSDLFELFYLRLDINGSTDRWGLLREMERDLKQTEELLQSGNFAVTFIGGLVALVFAITGKFLLAGIALSVFAILVSLMAFYRVVIVDIISFNPYVYREATTREILIRKGWNSGLLTSGKTVLIPPMALVRKFAPDPYRRALTLLGDYYQRKFAPDEIGKWEGSS